MSYIKGNHNVFIEECPTIYNTWLDNNPVGEHFMNQFSDWNYTLPEQLPGKHERQQAALRKKSLWITHSMHALNWIATQSY